MVQIQRIVSRLRLRVPLGRAVWPYLDKFKSGSKIEDVNFNGPALGVAFRW
jgi:hypothetical protein